MSKVNISKHFAQRIAEKLREPLAPAPKGRRASSLFYDVRPARIVGEWLRNDAGVWTAKANFIVGDAVDASFEFDVAAPLALESKTAPTAADATAFVVWRGRWELLTASTNNSLATGRIEALGAEPHYYVVRDSETDTLVDAYDPIGYGTLAGITLLVGQFVVYDYSETLKFHVILNASPL